MRHSIMLGAVAYDPKVVTIWDGFQAWFAERDLAFDYVLYSNYERQVRGHFAGEFDVAWNSPLAWLETQRIATGLRREVHGFAMRDTDCDLTSLIVVPADSAATSLADLRGKRVAVGAPDSPQATLIPLRMLAEAGLRPGVDVEIVEHDVLYGKHGDHIGGERDGARALAEGRVDAACMIDGNHLVFSREGTLPPGTTRVLAQTDRYDHCIFTALDDAPVEAVGRFRELILGQDYADPEVRPLLDLEGLRQWKPGRTEGFRQLAGAIDELDYRGSETVRRFIADAIAELGG